MKHLFAVIIFVLALIPAARADMFDMVNVPNEEKLTYKCSYKGIDLEHPAPKPYSNRYLTGEALMSAIYDTKFVGDGPNRHLESTVSGVSHSGYSIQYIFKFKPGPKLTVMSFEKVILFPNGKKIRSEYYDFSDSIPPLPREMAHPYTLHLALRGMDFTSGKQRSFHIWYNPTQVFNMKIVVKGEDEVTAPAGTFKCYRLDVIPDLVDFAGPIMGRALKPLLAGYVVWVNKEYPHQIIKYQVPFGMINLVGGPTEIYELSKIGN